MSIDASVAHLSGNVRLSDGFKGFAFLLIVVAGVWLALMLATSGSDPMKLHPVCAVLLVAAVLMVSMHVWADKSDSIAQLNLFERQAIALEEKGLKDVVVGSQQYGQYFTAIDTDGSEICGQLVALPRQNMIGGEDKFQVVPGQCS